MILNEAMHFWMISLKKLPSNTASIEEFQQCIALIPPPPPFKKQKEIKIMHSLLNETILFLKKCLFQEKNQNNKSKIRQLYH